MDEKLLQLLACPKCRGELALLPAGDGLSCAGCGVVYPVREGIPVMLVEEAVPQAKWMDAPRKK